MRKKTISRSNAQKYSVIFVLLVIFSTNAFAGGSGNTYYANVTAKLSSVTPTGAGTVYVPSDSNQSDSGATYSTESKGGNGTSTQKVVEVQLYSKANDGFIFVGWTTTNGTKDVISGSNKSPYTKSFETGSKAGKNNAKAHTIYAVFRRKAYTVHFDANGGQGTSMQDQAFEYGVSQNLSTNQFTKETVLTFDTNGGTAITAQSKNVSFSGWMYNNTLYGNEQQVNNLTSTDGATINMVAQWGSASFTLPTPTKTIGGISREFDGWYDSANDGTKVGNAGETYNISANTTLYAHWKEHNITINISGTPAKEGDTILFNVKKTDSPTVSYVVPITIGNGATAILMSVPRGSYSITPNSWGWNYTVSPSSAADNISSNKTFNFTVTSKNSSKNNDEKSKVNWGNGN